MAIQQVMAKSPDYWFALGKWAKDRGVLEPSECELAIAIGKLVSKRSVVNEKQALGGIKLISKAKESGFSVEC